MKHKKVEFAELGLLAGIILGGGLGVTLFASTGQVMFLTFAGAGACIGVMVGTGLDQVFRPPAS